MDPGFRLIQALMAAREKHRKVGHLLPDWPTVIKDTHADMQDDLDMAWRAAWDLFTAPIEGADPDNPGKDATAAPCGDDVGADKPAKVCQTATHNYDPPDNASLRDEPPSRHA